MDVGAHVGGGVTGILERLVPLVPGSASNGDLDSQKSVNTGVVPKSCCLDAGGGVPGGINLPLHVGGIFRVRAVPGAEIYHSGKKVNTEIFFVRLVRSAGDSN